MEIRRFFVTPESIVGEHITIVGEEYVHLSAVLRYKVGYQAIVCDNTGYDYWCEVEQIDRQKAILRIVKRERNETEPKHDITLFAGMIKPEKFEIALQKAVELGANRIVPFISEHTVEKTIRLDRANRIALESCKQCGRAVVPTIGDVISYREIWDNISNTDVYFAYEKEDTTTLAQALKERRSDRPIAIVVGSEGGFTKEEVEYAQEHGATVVSLGKRILRAETASIVALGLVVALTEEV